MTDIIKDKNVFHLLQNELFKRVPLFFRFKVNSLCNFFFKNYKIFEFIILLLYVYNESMNI